MKMRKSIKQQKKKNKYHKKKNKGGKKEIVKKQKTLWQIKLNKKKKTKNV